MEKDKLIVHQIRFPYTRCIYYFICTVMYTIMTAIIRFFKRKKYSLKSQSFTLQRVLHNFPTKYWQHEKWVKVPWVMRPSKKRSQLSILSILSQECTTSQSLLARYAHRNCTVGIEFCWRWKEVLYFTFQSSVIRIHQMKVNICFCYVCKQYELQLKKI
jgi:hypothetical protein